MSKRRPRGSKSPADHAGSFIVGALLGGLAGAAGTLWYTPWSGPELRARLFGPVSGAGSTVAETVGSVASPIVATASDAAGKGKELVAPVTEKVGAAVGKGVDAAGSAVQGVAGQVQGLAGRGDETTDEAEVAQERPTSEKPIQTL